MANNSYQFNLFNFGKEHYKITKPIRLIELFSGVGAQAKALEILGVPFEHWKTCEWAVPSIKAYNSIHLKDFADYSVNKTKQELIDYLQGNISTDYNTPCDVSKKNEQWLRETYNHCIATHNMMNIMKIGGKDLEIVDVDKYCYIITYSFPCQDLSLAGTRKGMATSQADGGTRSGLLWEVERLLDELYGAIPHRHIPKNSKIFSMGYTDYFQEGNIGNLPQVLLMENVPEVIGSKNVKHFNKWLAKLESLGYSNFFQILNAKDYGIPQNRKRCFMVSILGEWAYDFPLKIKLEYRLKDLLEKMVAQKYYLTDEHIERISNWKAQQKPLENMQNNVLISPTLTARGAGEDHSGMVLIDTELFEEGEVVDFDSSDEFRREHSTEETPSLLTHPKLAVVEKDNDESDGGGIPIVEATKKGYKVAHDGDGVDIGGRMKSHRGTVQKGLAQTLKTDCDVGVVVEDEEN